MKLTKKQINDAVRLKAQIGKCRAWITGYEAGSGNVVLESDALRQVQILLGEIASSASPESQGGKS